MVGLELSHIKLELAKSAVLTALQVEICKKQLVWGSRHDFCKLNRCSWLIMGVLTPLFSIYEKSRCHLNLGKATKLNRKHVTAFSTYCSVFQEIPENPVDSEHKKRWCGSLLASMSTLFRGGGWTVKGGYKTNHQTQVTLPAPECLPPFLKL